MSSIQHSNTTAEKRNMKQKTSSKVMASIRRTRTSIAFLGRAKAHIETQDEVDAKTVHSIEELFNIVRQGELTVSVFEHMEIFLAMGLKVGRSQLLDVIDAFSLGDDGELGMVANGIGNPNQVL